MFIDHEINQYVFWYYTPMALKFTDHFKPVASVYDCMDELSAFKGAHSHLPILEKQLFRKVDLVFIGGQSLYEAKRGQHPSVHAFPSSIDAAHFGKARMTVTDPEDQAHIPHPRLGFFGVIDERFDTPDCLRASITTALPESGRPFGSNRSRRSESKSCASSLTQNETCSS